ncbi:hypothetical protein EI94DRAFT_1811874 [Lactarius quietus]|nr:hypothetical protein EI94DRAFT_1811874 [Lactarius quietus]
MSALRFDVDLEDDAISRPKPSVPPIDAVLAPNDTEHPAEEIPLSELVRPHPSPPRSSILMRQSSPPLAAAQLSALPEALLYSPLALPASSHMLVQRDLFEARL